MTDQRLRAARASIDRGDGAAAARMAGAIVDDARVSPLVRSLALRLRAEARGLMGDLAAALDDARRAAELVPGDARAWNALGIAAADAGEHADAVEAFSRATSVDATYARAWNNLGNALRVVGRADDALATFERAVGADARYAHGWANLAVARRDAGDESGAIDAAKRALAIDPRQRAARLLLAGIDRRSGRLDTAIVAYEGALAERPDDAPVRFALAGALAERDDLDAARAAYAHAARTSPRLLRARLGAALTLPMIPASKASIREARAAFAAGLERLRDELPAVATTMPQGQVLRELCWTNFLLAYQGQDDLELQSAYGDLVATTLAASRGPAIATAPAPRAVPGRRRVAFVSAFFRDGTVGRYFESWITGLDPDRFEVVVHQLGASSDELTGRLRHGAAKFVSHRAREPAEIARAIMEDSPDCIVYPELGMDATTFALASLRLAPLQCSGWGHPVTSGLATIDLMFSAGAMEPADGAAHYRERLVRLPGLGTRYARPVPPMRVARDSLGLPVGPVLFLVPQSLFKLHPDDDRRIARVLAAAKGSRVVAFAGRHPKLTVAWRARLGRELDAGGVDASRVVVLPQVDHDDYLRINLACDAMLDSVRWSGGNTSLDAIACGLPIATRPGAFMRGRQSAGMLELIGAADLVAADEDALVANAVRLAEDAPWRAELSARMRDGSKALFDDVEPVAALAAALDGR